MEEEYKKQVLASFGRRLSVLRKRKKLSFRRLSSLCDIDSSDIQKYEKGQVDLRLLTVVDLAMGLGVNPSELLDLDIDVLKK